MSWLVELLVPVVDRSDAALTKLQRTLADRFGGVTAYGRSPAHGRWRRDEKSEEVDDIVLVEVMTPDLDRRWWAALRADLEAELDQDEIVIRAHRIDRL